MKYRMLICDDEDKIIQLIRELGHWEEHGIEIVATCGDGAEALDQIRALSPDIVLTDIKMPIYDGIELIERTASMTGARPHFIVLSGYKHFEYARSAIQLGVVDYLLKPLDEAQLNRTLEKTCRMIDAGKELDQRHRQLEDYQRQDREQAQMKLLDALLCGGDVPASNQECNALYKTEFQSELFRCVYLSTNLDSLLCGNGSLFSEKMRESIQALLGAHHQYAVFSQRMGVLLIVNYDKSRREQIKQAISALYYSLKNLTEIYGNFVLNIGVSREKDDIRLLGQALEEAREAEWGRLVLMGDKVLEYDVIKGLPRFADTDLLPSEQGAKLKGYVKYFQLDAIGECFAEIAKSAGEYQSFHPGDMRRFIHHLEALLFPIQLDEQTPQQMEDIRYELNIAYKKAADFKECVRMLYLYLEDFLGAKLRTIQENKGRPIDQARRYIDAHCEQQLSLESVAERVHLSPTYFSKLFKLEVGTGFTEYLTDVRIEKAKQLLLETDDSIKAIAWKVGYQDDKYFSKLFRKQVGIKPSDYKKLYMG